MSRRDLLNIKWMRRAIKLAQLGIGSTSPNPLVGAVILNKFGDLIAEGFHHKAGEPHAEAMAFNNLKSDPKGGVLYVNLEPCCHQGKTPPCVDKIINSGIEKVYISIKDPDQRVSGKGIKKLKESGIKTYLGLCEKESFELNKPFIHRCLTGQSYGVLKWAMSLDGRIGLKNGVSKWISNQSSRTLVHTLRSEFDAIVIGGNTLRKDNPFLNTRGKKFPEPLRVVFSRTLDLPEKANFWNIQKSNTLIVYDASKANEANLKKIPEWIETEKLPSDNPKLLSQLLAKRGCNKILWECGPKLATSALKNNCIQETITFIAPKILGGIDNMSPFLDFGFNSIEDAFKLNNLEKDFIDNDIFIRNTL